MHITGVGDRGAQTQFLQNFEPFLTEHLKVRAVYEKVFLRNLADRPEEEFTAINGLPEEDPKVIELENRISADRVVFYLGRICVDDYGEIIILAGNGRGAGAFKILRGMYERAVTAGYIAKHPSEARVFAEENVIQDWKIWNRALKFAPELKNRYTTEQLADFEARYREAKAKKSETLCNKCNQPKTAEAWTRLDLASMADQTDSGLALLYGPCYLEPTFHSHATSFGVNRRLQRTAGDTGWTFRPATENEARQALKLSNELILRVVAGQNDYFQLGLDSEIQALIDAYVPLWDKIPESNNVP